MITYQSAKVEIDAWELLHDSSTIGTKINKSRSGNDAMRMVAD